MRAEIVVGCGYAIERQLDTLAQFGRAEATKLMTYSRPFCAPSYPKSTSKIITSFAFKSTTTRKSSNIDVFAVEVPRQGMRWKRRATHTARMNAVYWLESPGKARVEESLVFQVRTFDVMESVRCVVEVRLKIIRG